jgi:hypothetical protein
MALGRPLRDADSVRKPSRFPQKKVSPMHDLIIASIFAAMILIPCIVASASGKTSEEKA